MIITSLSILEEEKRHMRDNMNYYRLDAEENISHLKEKIKEGGDFEQEIADIRKQAQEKICLCKKRINQIEEEVQKIVSK